MDSIRRYVATPYEILVGIDQSDVTRDRQLWNTLGSWGVPAYLLPQRIGSLGNQNRLWHELYERGCDVIVMFEDDVEIIAPDPVADLIAAAQVSGVDHFTLRCPYDIVQCPEYSRERNDVNSELKTIGGVRFSFSKNIGRLEYGEWFHTRTEVVYLTRRCIEQVGYMDESLGPWSGPGHPDYTFRARRAGLYPKDWYISPTEVVAKIRYDLCGRSNCTDEEISKGNENIKRIRGNRPIFVPYAHHPGELACSQVSTT